MKCLSLSCIAFVWILASGCATQRVTHERLDGVLWYQTSVESEMAATQAFLIAKDNVDQALVDPTWTAALEQSDDYQTFDPAVIVDVDETVLDNSPFQARLTKSGIPYDHNLWQAWVREANANPMPGARQFIQYLKSNGIKVFYVTNRELEDPTVRNLRAVLDSEVEFEDVLCKNEKPNWGSNKTSRRQLIADQYRILLLVGDDYNDFAFLGKVEPDKRKETAKDHKAYWGKKWIIVSNPLYGNWEKALYQYDYNMSDAEVLKTKYGYLETGEP